MFARHRRVHVNAHAGLVHVLLQPRHERAEARLVVAGGSHQPLAAEFAGLFKKIHVMAALGQRERAAHARQTAADHIDVPGLFGRTGHIGVFHHQGGVHRAAHAAANQSRARGPGLTVVAAHAAADAVFLAAAQLAHVVGIGQQRTRNADEVGHAVGNHLVRFMRIVQTAACNDGHIGKRLLDLGGVGDVLRRTFRIDGHAVPQTFLTAARHEEGVHTGLGQIAHLFNALVEGHAAFHVVALREADVHGEVVAGALADGFHDHAGKRDALFRRAAEVVGAAVAVGGQELTDELAGTAVQRKAVESGFVESLARLGVAFDVVENFLTGHFSGNHEIPGAAHRRRRNAFLLRARAGACAAELQKHLCAAGLDERRQLRELFNVLVVPQGKALRQLHGRPRKGLLHGDETGLPQAGPVKGKQRFAHKTVFRSAPGLHRSLNVAVGYFKIPDFRGGEKVRKSHLMPPCNLSNARQTQHAAVSRRRNCRNFDCRAAEPPDDALRRALPTVRTRLQAQAGRLRRIGRLSEPPPSASEGATTHPSRPEKTNPPDR